MRTKTIKFSGQIIHSTKFWNILFIFLPINKTISEPVSCGIVTDGENKSYRKHLKAIKTNKIIKIVTTVRSIIGANTDIKWVRKSSCVAIGVDDSKVRVLSVVSSTISPKFKLASCSSNLRRFNRSSVTFSLRRLENGFSLAWSFSSRN